jgi:hypothetical protein
MPFTEGFSGLQSDQSNTVQLCIKTRTLHDTVDSMLQHAFETARLAAMTALLARIRML